jgi:hypothetical protein
MLTIGRRVFMNPSTTHLRIAYSVVGGNGEVTFVHAVGRQRR